MTHPAKFKKIGQYPQLILLFTNVDGQVANRPT